MASTTQPTNRLLAGLPKAELALLDRHLVEVPMRVRDPLYEFDEPIRDLYFPSVGVASCVAPVQSDSGAPSEIEVATVGNEGFVGVPVFLGATSTKGNCFVQIAGSALKMKASRFREIIERTPRFQTRLKLYTQALLTLIAQSSACNRAHVVEHRCARWLLMSHDRVGGDSFPLTHEFLGQMLGVRRASVTAAARTLQRAGLIRYARGVLTIRDRAGLERASCECYRIIRDEFDRLLPSRG